jgi:hypothetical protein
VKATDKKFLDFILFYFIFFWVGDTWPAAPAIGLCSVPVVGPATAACPVGLVLLLVLVVPVIWRFAP